MRATFILIVPSLIVGLVTRTSVAHATVLTGTQEEQVVKLIALPQPYIIRGDYYVPPGKELVIEAGASFFAEKDAAISVSGTLLINGTREKPVSFGGKASGRSYWKGVTLQEAQRAEVRCCEVTGAASAFVVRKCTALFHDCVLTANESGLKIVRGGRGRVDGCVITGNKGDGIYLELSAADVSSCTISRNKGWGIATEHKCPTTSVERTVISENGRGGVLIRMYGKVEAHGSSISKNRDHDIRNESTQDQDFPGNWWGEAPTKLLISKGDTANLPNIHDGHDEEGKGKVRLDDFLREMPKDCGAFAAEAKDQAIRKGSKLRFTRACYVVLNSKHFSGFHKALSDNNTAEVKEYVQAGYVVKIEEGATAVAVAARGPAYGVRLLDGEHKGKQGWVLKADVEAGR